MPRLGLCNLHSSGLHATASMRFWWWKEGGEGKRLCFCFQPLLASSEQQHKLHFPVLALEYQLWGVPQGIQVPALITPSGQGPTMAALLWPLRFWGHSSYFCPPASRGSSRFHFLTLLMSGWLQHPLVFFQPFKPGTVRNPSFFVNNYLF